MPDLASEINGVIATLPQLFVLNYFTIMPVVFKYHPATNFSN